MSPKAKHAVTYRHKEEYPVSVMYRFFGVFRSGYDDFVHRLDRPERDEYLADKDTATAKGSPNTYGYRRMQFPT